MIFLRHAAVPGHVSPSGGRRRGKGRLAVGALVSKPHEVLGAGTMRGLSVVVVVVVKSGVSVAQDSLGGRPGEGDISPWADAVVTSFSVLEHNLQVAQKLQEFIRKRKLVLPVLGRYCDLLVMCVWCL